MLDSVMAHFQHVYQLSVRCSHILYFCLHSILVLFCEALWCSSLTVSRICGSRMQAIRLGLPNLP